eukprot:2052105-Pleurochrysis_carterae.AAC.4
MLPSAANYCIGFRSSSPNLCLRENLEGGRVANAHASASAARNSLSLALRSSSSARLACAKDVGWGKRGSRVLCGFEKLICFRWWRGLCWEGRRWGRRVTCQFGEESAVPTQESFSGKGGILTPFACVRDERGARDKDDGPTSKATKVGRGESTGMRQEEGTHEAVVFLYVSPGSFAHRKSTRFRWKTVARPTKARDGTVMIPCNIMTCETYECRP